MPRKTIEVAYLVEKGNYFLAHSEPEQREQRLGFCSMIECALHKADVYAGYLHLDSAGIDREKQERYPWEFSWNEVCKDDSRRAYMMKGAPIPSTRTDRKI